MHWYWQNVGKDNYKWAATWQNQQSDCALSEDPYQPGHLPSLIRVFVVRMKKAWVLSYSLSAQRRIWSDWADAQADLSLRWAHSHFVVFVMSRLKLFFVIFQLNFGPWLMSEFCFHLISWEQIDEILWMQYCDWHMKFFRTFQQSYGPWMAQVTLLVLSCRGSNYFSLYFNRVVALECCQNFVSI